MNRYVTKEEEKQLPQATRLIIRWHWFWFRNLWSDIRRRKVWRGSFYINTRFANARDLNIGPLLISIRRRWLSWSARALHPKVFSKEE